MEEKQRSKRAWIVYSLVVLLIAAGLTSIWLSRSFFLAQLSEPPPSLIKTTKTPSATSTHTITSTASPLSTSTLTPTITNTPTKTPTITPTPLLVFVTTFMANVRAGPNTSYSVIAQVEKGQALQAIGRHPNNVWLLIQLPDGRLGWIFVYAVEVEFDIETLPVFERTPTLTPIPTNTRAPTITPRPRPTETPKKTKAPYGQGILTPPNITGIAPTAVDNPARRILSLVSVILLIGTVIVLQGANSRPRQGLKPNPLLQLLQMIVSMF